MATVLLILLFSVSSNWATATVVRYGWQGQNTDGNFYVESLSTLKINKTITVEAEAYLNIQGLLGSNLRRPVLDGGSGDTNNTFGILPRAIGTRLFHVKSNGSLVLENIVIQRGYHNMTGGGLFVEGGNATLKNCLVTENIAEMMGGGVHIYAGATVNLINTTFSKNQARQGGGIHIGYNTAVFTDETYSDVLIQNCILVENYLSIPRIVTGENGEKFLLSYSTIEWFRTKQVYGGGIFIGGGNVVMKDVNISNNRGKLPYTALPINILTLTNRMPAIFALLRTCSRRNPVIRFGKWWWSCIN
jgi:predicted outer membrane repeat protein